MGHIQDQQESLELDSFLELHRYQLISSGVPEHFWDSLNSKLINKTFDAGSSFQIVRLELEYEEREIHEPHWALQSLCFMECDDSQHIYLIDHAWTYKIEHAKQQLFEHDGLRVRLGDMLGLDINISTEQLVDDIFNNMWKINNYYSVSSAENVEDRLPVWYVMDEVGSSVSHDGHPNCRIVPFFYIKDQITYSLLFPIEDIQLEDLLYRDFGEGIAPEKRPTQLLPWSPKSFEDFDTNPPIPDEEYYLSGHVEESLPDLKNLHNSSVRSGKDVLKVFSQYNLIKTHLTSNRFDVVESRNEADILWYTQHFKDFQKLSDSPHQFINQFPFEYVLTVKDLLSATCRRKQNVNWLPITYNLLSEAPNFISCFQKRDREGLENYWIVKPYNLARGLDIHITNNLDYICRLIPTGPKIVQKYITNPVLFYRPECNGKVKFDIRYVLLLKSVKPLQAYVYKKFFLRFSNQPFELNDFEVYEKHFTVMNYTDGAQLKHMNCDTFKLKWKKQFPENEWKGVEKSILEMLREILECATMANPPCGIAESPQSRALYAADIMLEWTDDKKIQPKILEINFTPDCSRACDYYPDFYNDIFSLLFLNVESSSFLSL
ncbi:unnamed protein product [Phaedon cochleariae]|uniref:Tubulin--tyrosine ligase-like protein 12 SET-like domain-containing protein n=1 Tax=Phaedon cochleariae TaxID=80249 RepID=A0A9P0DDY9_PHACE|nr:unnamed protein product [Phaedon cochleariae]